MRSVISRVEHLHIRTFFFFFLLINPTGACEGLRVEAATEGGEKNHPPRDRDVKNGLRLIRTACCSLWRQTIAASGFNTPSLETAQVYCILLIQCVDSSLKKRSTWKSSQNPKKERIKKKLEAEHKIS